MSEKFTVKDSGILVWGNKTLKVESPTYKKRVIDTIRSKIVDDTNLNRISGDSQEPIEPQMSDCCDSYIERLLESKTISSATKCNTTRERLDWFDLYPDFPKRWMAQFADLLEGFKIFKPVDAYIMDNKDIPLKWYHLLFPYKLVIMYSETLKKVYVSACLIKPHTNYYINVDIDIVPKVPI